ncbi:hypothetical protein [Chryseobacterium camelliae]|uniref:hypothetical protein n=1 Tax=Chryseobacterium camelliae TaxID=1265445 RepID=UPI000C1C8BB8|nr:hypothetical protein [Chryseobacterium camelliae]
MIRISSKEAKAMEFTRFRKKESVTDDELLYAALKFEKAIASKNGLIFHCLVRNYDNEYANVLFSETMLDLKELANHFGQHPDVQNFFELIEMPSVSIEYHTIQKEKFVIPSDFSCIEKGTFSLIDINDEKKLLNISEDIEHNYLKQSDNTRAHFIGQVESNVFSEITFGRTLAQTKQICMGYFNNAFCMKLMNLAKKDTMNLDFWYIIA